MYKFSVFANTSFEIPISKYYMEDFSMSKNCKNDYDNCMNANNQASDSSKNNASNEAKSSAKSSQAKNSSKNEATDSAAKNGSDY